jgi:hypothetical protein
MGVTRSPLRPTRLPWYSREAARSHDLMNLWLKEHHTIRDQESEHPLRDLLAQIGVPVRPYKGPRPGQKSRRYGRRGPDPSSGAA